MYFGTKVVRTKTLPVVQFIPVELLECEHIKEEREGCLAEDEGRQQ
jgi:hypothetical protein